MKRLLLGFRIGWWAFRSAEVLDMSLFQMLTDLLRLILKVAHTDKHFGTKVILHRDVEQPVVWIWAGAGVNADPYKRIQELAEENENLKDLVKQSAKEIEG